MTDPIIRAEFGVLSEVVEVLSVVAKGRCEIRLPALTNAADKGDLDAAIAAAKILSYLGTWDQAAVYAKMVILGFDHDTDFDLVLDMWRIVTLQGIMSDNWRVADEAVQECSRYYLGSNAKSSVRVSYYRAFMTYIKSRAMAPLVFPLFPEVVGDKRQRQSDFNKVRKKCLSDFRSYGNAMESYFLKRAVNRLFDSAAENDLPKSAIDFLNTYKIYPSAHFQLLFIARAFLLAGETRRANHALKLAFQSYIPANMYDVLPTTIFWDEQFFSYLNSKRSKSLLNLKRGKGYQYASHGKILPDFEEAKRFLEPLDRARAEQACWSEIERWEKLLSIERQNLLLRVKLCHNYALCRMGDAISNTRRTEHILWFIKNSPDFKMLETIEFSVFEDSNSEQIERIKHAWLRQVKRHPDNAQVGINAAVFLQVSQECQLAMEVLESYANRYPEDTYLLDRLLYLYVGKYSLVEDAGGLASKALPLCKKLLVRLQQTCWYKDSIPAWAAWFATDCGQLEEATIFANQTLKQVQDHEARLTIIAYSALGRVAFVQRHPRVALFYLESALKTGLEQDASIDHFGVALILMSEIVEGDLDAVLALLSKLEDNCSQRHKREIRYWIRLLKQKEEVSFLSYVHSLCQIL